ncbi:reverse transcriptase [Aspergillus terreus]|uniref:Reverse transcriptase n=1 Tax=Aspergillus terreus TaxID=33178 RepID=A0A5M3ZBL7_ASPTE|nr:hypothetical protein ATETN484_0013001000 [Aspergillus terreus]GFF21839.1 reverse transcriptase [Aspergillus terreus]
MTDRKARVRLQKTTPLAPLACGLSQGSLASPILFLLYTEPIYWLGFLAGPNLLIKAKAYITSPRYGYADDTAVLSIGRSLQDSAKLAAREVTCIIDRGNRNGVTFDPRETEVMHFSCRNLDRGISPPVMHGDIAKRPEEAIRWLRVWLDRKLSFRTYVEKWAGKARESLIC